MTTVFVPVADARVESAYATKNFGTSSEGAAYGDASSNKRHTYLRFAVTGLSGTVHAAKLRLRTTSDGGVGVSVAATTSSWVESGTGGITWNTRPAPTSGSLGTSGRAGDSTWLDVPLAGAVSGNGTYSFAVTLASSTSTDGLKFSLRESSYDPQLVVTTSG